jgi:subtilase family protein
VLGIVLANEVGAAPNVDSAVVVSNQGVDGHVYTADAVALAASKLRRGDVMLIEYECSVTGYHPLAGRSVGVPVEYDACVCEAIRLATKAGVVVIEPGGNGDNANFAMNLDVLRRDDGTNLVRGDDRFVDSGAIVVSAAKFDEDASRNERLEWAPYGSRVDCYARGTPVMTCRKGNGNPATAVLKSFDGTSAAAAIIAATALQVQGISLKVNDAPLDPDEIRPLFAGLQHGTAAKAEDPERHIGPMPDLARLLEAVPVAHM